MMFIFFLPPLQYKKVRQKDIGDGMTAQILKKVWYIQPNLPKNNNSEAACQKCLIKTPRPTNAGGVNNVI